MKLTGAIDVHPARLKRTTEDGEPVDPRITNPAVMTAASGALEMAPPGHGISFDLSRSHAEDLLTGFHAGTQGVDLGTRLTDLGDLPHQKLRLARNAGRPWTAWPTPSEPIAACEDYDLLAPAWA